jgi:hypothetical protein
MLVHMIEQVIEEIDEEVEQLNEAADKAREKLSELSLLESNTFTELDASRMHLQNQIDSMA